MEPGEEFDQTGFELPPVPGTRGSTDGQQELFSDDWSQPDAADGEPVFWPASTGPNHPEENYLQPDAPE